MPIRTLQSRFQLQTTNFSKKFDPMYKSINTKSSSKMS